MKYPVTVTTLIENDSADPANLVAEHGLSLHINYNGQNILFDTGATGDFVDNAAKLGVDLTTIDLVIISHSHYDHTGGLERFFTLNHTAPVYMHSLARSGYYSRRDDEVTSIGLEESVYSANADRFIFIDQRTEINDSLTIVTEYDKQYPVPQSPTLLKKENGELVVDDFQHEIMLILHEKDEMVVFTGCSHNGILNMVSAAKNVFPERKIQAVLGGFHLSSRHSDQMTLPKETVLAMGEQLKTWGIPQVFTGHCTGHPAYALLKTVLADKLGAFPGGTVIQL